MGYKGLALKIGLFVLIGQVYFFPAEDNISVQNPFTGVIDQNANQFFVAQDSALDVWFLTNHELYRYSKEGLKKFAGKEAGIIQIWGFDKVYAMCVRGEEANQSSPGPGSRYYTLEIFEDGKLKKLEESSQQFIFHRSMKGDRILINSKGEIILNGKVVEKLDVPQDNVWLFAIWFSETVPGLVWVWADEREAHSENFKKNIILIQDGKVNRISCEALGIKQVSDIIEPVEGTVYIGQCYYDPKCVKISYSTGKNGLEIKKDTEFDEKSFIPLMHKQAADGKLWMLSGALKTDRQDLSCYFEGKFVKFASDVGGNHDFCDSRDFMLFDNGYIWLRRNTGPGINLVLPNGKVNSYDMNQGIRISGSRQIIKLPDGKILLANGGYDGTNWYEGRFQILKENSAKILSATKVEKYYEEFKTYGEIITDNKGNYYWEAYESRVSSLKKYDGKKTVGIPGWTEFKKEKDREKQEIKYFGRGIDSEGKSWIIYSKKEEKSQNKYAAIFKSDGTFAEEDFYDALLKRCRANKEFQIEDLRKSFKMFFCAPGTVLLQENQLGRGSSVNVSSFKNITVYRENEKVKELKENSLKGLEEQEFILEGFNMTPEGKPYVATWDRNTNLCKDTYIYEAGEWKKSPLFYPNKLFEDNRWKNVSVELNAMFGEENISSVVKYVPDADIFTLKTTGLYMHKAGGLWKFKDIPGEFYNGEVGIYDAFTDVYGNLWVAAGKYSAKTWIRIKKEDIAKVIQKTDKEYLTAKIKLKEGPRYLIALEEGVISGERKVEVKTEVKPSKLETKTQEYERYFNDLVSGKGKELNEAEKYFKEGGSEALKFLEAKKADIKDAYVVWKIDAILTRMR